MGNQDNIKITKSVSGTSTVITIDTVKMSRVLNDAMTPLTFPSMPQEGDTPKPTKIIDLLRIETRYNIDGHITFGKPSGDSSETAKARKDDLVNIFKANGIFTFTWEGSDKTGIMDKLTIDKMYTDGLDPANDGETGYFVKFTIIEGVDL